MWIPIWCVVVKTTAVEFSMVPCRFAQNIHNILLNGSSAYLFHSLTGLNLSGSCGSQFLRCTWFVTIHQAIISKFLRSLVILSYYLPYDSLMSCYSSCICLVRIPIVLIKIQILKQLNDASLRNL